MLTWCTKYALDIIAEVHDVCYVYAANLVDYREVLKVLIDKGTSYIKQLDLDPQQFPIIGKTLKLFDLIVKKDQSHKLWLC